MIIRLLWLIGFVLCCTFTAVHGYITINQVIFVFGQDMIYISYLIAFVIIPAACVLFAVIGAIGSVKGIIIGKFNIYI